MQRHASYTLHRSLAACIAFALLASGTPAARAADPKPAAGRDGWFEGVPRDHSFRVRGPAAFETFHQEDGKDPAHAPRTEGVRATQPAAFDGVNRYMASCVVQEGDRRDAKQRIEETLAHWSAQAKFLYQRPARAGNLDGTEFQIADRTRTMRVRVFATRTRTCTVLVQWNRVAKPREDDVVRFLDSFTPSER